jgi:hypothetical protein
MRGVPVATLLPLLLVTALAGCSAGDRDGAGAESGSSGSPTEGPGRVARGGGSEDHDGANRTPEMREVRILEEPLRMLAEQGPVSFGLEVPPQADRVEFRFSRSPTFYSVGLRIDLTGCGGIDRGSLGLMGHTGGDLWNRLCGPAEPGPQTVAISGQAVVFDGVFVLTAFVPLDSLDVTASA